MASPAPAQAHHAAAVSVDQLLADRARCCFCVPWPRKAALERVKDWTETVAAPRWKSFLRRLRRSPRIGGGGKAKFGYDPLSYALNFDDGEGVPRRSFFVRTAAVAAAPPPEQGDADGQ